MAFFIGMEEFLFPDPPPLSDISVSPAEALVLVRSLPLMEHVPEATVKRISEALHPVRFQPCEPIVRLNREGAAVFYIIWSGEAKVISPPSDHPRAHKESLLKRGDYFGTPGPVRRRYRCDVVANPNEEVVCLVLSRDHADLLSAVSIFFHDTPEDGPSLMERLMDLETVGPAEDMRTRGIGLSSSPFYRHIEGSKAPVVWGNWFGGQLICQALLAATRTVKSELQVHSLHSYFVQAANVEFPTVYQVEKSRDGRSFATRHVKATQNNTLVFVLYASFKTEATGFEHSEPMPRALPPEESVPIEQRFDEFLTDPRFSPSKKKKFAGFRLGVSAIEVRYVDPIDGFRPVRVDPARKMTWIRSRDGNVGREQGWHQCVAAYASDIAFLETALLPHPESVGVQMRTLSLDHSIWFHRPFKADEWLLYVSESPTASGGRGLILGRLYTQDGRLVMSTAQEGVIQEWEHQVKRVAKL